MDTNCEGAVVAGAMESRESKICGLVMTVGPEVAFADLPAVGLSSPKLICVESTARDGSEKVEVFGIATVL